MKKIMIQKITQNNWNFWTVNLIMRAKKIVNQSSDFPVRHTGSYRHKKALSSGRPFQIPRPGVSNERSATVARRDGRTSCRLEVDDRRRPLAHRHISDIAQFFREIPGCWAKSQHWSMPSGSGPHKALFTIIMTATVTIVHRYATSCAFVFTMCDCDLRMWYNAMWLRCDQK